MPPAGIRNPEQESIAVNPKTGLAAAAETAPPKLRRMALVVEYQGTNYHGFQLQLNPPTIQGELEQALRRFTGQPIRIRGASRTDSGAHAMGQVADFLMPAHRPAERLLPALNYFLPEDIRVLRAFPVAPDFHARRSALGRVYRYRILNRPWPSPLLRHTHLWERQPLKAEAMAEAAHRLVGIHDFRPLASGHPPERSAVRQVARWEVRRDGDTLTIECEANGFLKQQIRKANGILRAIGLGKLPVEAVSQALQGQSAALEAPTLPANGLCLVEVKYPEGVIPPASGNTGKPNEAN